MDLHVYLHIVEDECHKSHSRPATEHDLIEMEDRLTKLIKSTAADNAEIEALAAKLKLSSDPLNAAIQAETSGGTKAEPPKEQTRPNRKFNIMASPILNVLADQVTANTTVEGSAMTLINGFAGRVQAAVDAALAGGATKEDLAPVQAEVDAMKSSAQALTDAITANTPAASQAKRK